MKNKLNLGIIALMLALFACQKEQSSEELLLIQKSVTVCECITFDNPNLAAGTTPTQLYTDNASGPIGISGLPNPAMIFDSSNPTGNDDDLGTPNETFPGGVGIGDGGELGEPYQNDSALGKVLIVTQNNNPADPNDLNGPGEFDFDFSAIGPVTVKKMHLLDIEGKEGPPLVRFYDAGMTLIDTFLLQTTGDNGLELQEFNGGSGVANVTYMEVLLGGSGAIDNICIILPPPPPPGGGCTHTIGYWKTHAGLGNGNQADVVTQYLPITLGNGGGQSLVVSTAQEAVDILNNDYCGSPSNGVGKLYAQLLGAKLSIADGADPTPISAVITAADNWLTNNDCSDWSNAVKNMVNGWKDDLDAYNNGETNVAHCD